MAYRRKEDQREYNRKWMSRYFHNHKDEVIAKQLEVYHQNPTPFRRRAKVVADNLEGMWKGFLSEMGLLTCKVCGQDSEGRSVSFHHLDEDTKLFNISYVYRRWEFTEENKSKVLREIDKCLPVCGSCHRHLHYRGGTRNAIECGTNSKERPNMAEQASL